MKEYIVKVYDDGAKEWYFEGKLHREDGPAVENADGDKFWYLNDKIHREGGPAIECANGHKEWSLNGKLHREDGPAVEWADGRKFWYMNGIKMTEEEFLQRNQEVIVLNGKRYRLIED